MIFDFMRHGGKALCLVECKIARAMFCVFSLRRVFVEGVSDRSIWVFVSFGLGPLWLSVRLPEPGAILEFVCCSSCFSAWVVLSWCDSKTEWLAWEGDPCGCRGDQNAVDASER